MARPTPRTPRRLAWEDAKAAVRAYARDPSDHNAEQVKTLLAKARATGMPPDAQRPPHQPAKDA